jgi:hypothetical protein
MSLLQIQKLEGNRNSLIRQINSLEKDKSQLEPIVLIETIEALKKDNRQLKSNNKKNNEKLKKTNEKLEIYQTELKEKEFAYQLIANSWSFKLGYIIASPFRFVRKYFMRILDI